MTITYERLTAENFGEHSLDGFIRHQEVKEYWLKIDGSYVLVPNEYTEDWDREKCREIAREILSGIDNEGFAYGAFSARVH